MQSGRFDGSPSNHFFPRLMDRCDGAPQRLVQLQSLRVYWHEMAARTDVRAAKIITVPARNLRSRQQALTRPTLSVDDKR